jgi:hypothetical protein
MFANRNIQLKLQLNANSNPSSTIKCSINRNRCSPKSERYRQASKHRCEFVKSGAVSSRPPKSAVLDRQPSRPRSRTRRRRHRPHLASETLKSLSRTAKKYFRRSVNAPQFQMKLLLASPIIIDKITFFIYCAAFLCYFCFKK